MKSTSFTTIASLSVLAVSISGCGGGGSSAPSVAAPTLTVQPADASVLTGGIATFSVTAQGNGPTYQWLRNGVAISGATASTLTTSAASFADDAAVYTVTVTNAGGTVTSRPAMLHLALSGDQQVYENLILAPNGSYSFDWSLRVSGAQTSGTDWLYSAASTLAASPLTHGPQTVATSMPVSMAQSLALPARNATRELTGGGVLLVPTVGQSATVSYIGSAVQVDTLAQDGATVAHSEIRSNYASHPLGGALSATPAEMADPFNVIFTNPAVLSASATYQSGASYVTYSATQKGDRYDVFDCLAATIGAAPSPCNGATTLAAAMTSGEQSSSDGVTYHAADGTVSTVNGVPIWVATSPRPEAAVGSSTVEYRIYFQLNGNVYTGALVKDGTVIGGGHYTAAGGTTAYADYQVRLNKAARDSIAAASQL